MTIAAARQLPDGAVCFVGIGLPSTAANLARRTHAPNLVLVYESGTLGSKPDRLPLSIGDGELADTADSVISVPEVFNYWLQPGRIDVGFLSGAQIDRFANINSTVIGDYESPKVRLPGAGGAPEIAASCGEVVVLLRHNRRAFVERVDFVSSVGFGTGPGCRERVGAARPRPAGRRHRPRRAPSRPVHVRADADGAAARGDGRRGPRGHRLGPRRRRRRRRRAAADRRRARRPAPACRRRSSRSTPGRRHEQHD